MMTFTLHFFNCLVLTKYMPVLYAYLSPCLNTFDVENRARHTPTLYRAGSFLFLPDLLTPYRSGSSCQNCKYTTHILQQPATVILFLTISKHPSPIIDHQWVYKNTNLDLAYAIQ